MVKIDFEQIIEDEKLYVDYLIRARFFDILITEEVDRFKEDGVFNSENDIHIVHENNIKYLPHCCNNSCLVKNPDGTLKCQKLNYIRVSKENTRHQYIPLSK